MEHVQTSSVVKQISPEGVSSGVNKMKLKLIFPSNVSAASPICDLYSHQTSLSGLVSGYPVTELKC